MESALLEYNIYEVGRLRLRIFSYTFKALSRCRLDQRNLIFFFLIKKCTRTSYKCAMQCCHISAK